jgi:hypothetical protein
MLPLPILNDAFSNSDYVASNGLMIVNKLKHLHLFRGSLKAASRG